jgi:hypothetical protein
MPCGQGHCVIGNPDLRSDPIGEYLDSLAATERRQSKTFAAASYFNDVEIAL